MKIESTTRAQRHNRHLRVFVPSWLEKHVPPAARGRLPLDPRFVEPGDLGKEERHA